MCGERCILTVSRYLGYPPLELPFTDQGPHGNSLRPRRPVRRHLRGSALHRPDLVTLGQAHRLKSTIDRAAASRAMDAASSSSAIPNRAPTDVVARHSTRFDTGLRVWFARLLARNASEGGQHTCLQHALTASATLAEGGVWPNASPEAVRASRAAPASVARRARPLEKAPLERALREREPPVRAPHARARRARGRPARRRLARPPLAEAPGARPPYVAAWQRQPR